MCPMLPSEEEGPVGRGVTSCVPSGPHGEAHKADNGAAAEEDQPDCHWDEPPVPPYREYPCRAHTAAAASPCPTVCAYTPCGVASSGNEWGLKLSSPPLMGALGYDCEQVLILPLIFLSRKMMPLGGRGGQWGELLQILSL